MPLPEARGRVTLLTGERAPKVVPLAPEVVVKAPPFEPIDQGPGTGWIAHTRSWTIDDQLPSDFIICGHRAANGLMWFGTNGGGLSRFDGHSFTNFGIAHGLPDNVIFFVGSDRKGDVWIGSSTGGLTRYDGRTFTTLPISDATGMWRGVYCMWEDPDGTLWFGTRGDGLCRYDGHTFTKFTKKDGLQDNMVREIVRGSDGALWMTTTNGLSRFDGERFMGWPASAEIPFFDMGPIARGKDNDLWIGHDGDGITRCVFTNGKASFTHYPLIAGEVVHVQDLYLDDEGMMWIASPSHGVFRFDARAEEPPVISRFGTAQGLVNDKVSSIMEGSHGDLWFGTLDAGLVQYHGPAFSKFPAIRPLSLTEDKHGTLWIGTDSGLVRSDGRSMHAQPLRGMPHNQLYYTTSVDPQGRVGFCANVADPSKDGCSWYDGVDFRVIRGQDDRLRVDMVTTLFDRHGRFWTGGYGVDCYDATQRTTFTTRQGLGTRTVLSLCEAADGAIWAGTDGGGLSRIDSTSITTWTMAEGLPANTVWGIVRDRGGTLWIATVAGLCRYDGRTFRTFTTQDGLPDDNLGMALIDHDGELMLSMPNGISILSGWQDAQGNVVPFNGRFLGAPNDSLQAWEPRLEVYSPGTGFPVKNAMSFFEDSKGVVWICPGNNEKGLMRLERSALRPDTLPLATRLLSMSLGQDPLCWHSISTAPQDSITLVQQEVAVFGRTLPPGEREVLRRTHEGVTFTGIHGDPPLPQGLVLDYANNHPRFEFVGVETSRPQLVEYQHLLEGNDADWSAISKETAASYSNLREGRYTFKVRSKSPSGVWSDPTTYTFTVLPPWYRTWWMYAAYILAMCSVLVGVFKWRLALLTRQKERLENTVKERTAELVAAKEHAEQSEQVKQQFLANMSHEIRTPMNAIVGMSTALLHEEAEDEATRRSYMEAIAVSSESLMVIVNDILDLSKMEAGRLELERVPMDPRRVLANVVSVMRFRAEEKGLKLTFEVSDDVPAAVVGDPVRWTQVWMNLLGNAIKFTEQGSVSIRMDVQERKDDEVLLRCSVTDTGIGVATEKLNTVFDEFTQAESDHTRRFGGTGLGLTICKRLVEMQSGTIGATSTPGQGSSFTFTVPYTLATETAVLADHAPFTISHSPLRDLRILLAEDNKMNVMVAQVALKHAIPGVHVDVAANGRIAVDMAGQGDYDLILMDVQMPEMDGYDSAKAIRALNGPRSRTPIIAMTANVMRIEVDRYEGAGMNGIIPKPFKQEMLVEAIGKVIG